MALLLLFAAGTLAAFFTDQWPWVMLGFGLIAYIVGAIGIGSRMDSEKRERTARLLPSHPVGYGIIRFLVFVTYHLMIITIIAISNLVSGTTWLPLADLLTLFGFNMTITAVFFVNDDIFYIWGWWARTALWSLVILIAVYSAFTTEGLTFSISPGKPKSFAEATFFNAMWMLLMSLDVWIYTQRKSYMK
jgi:hypothetical protein